jgi:macrodomain Ter protein organizer (MatP/YcbG family)
MAKCLYCQEKAGWFKKICPECRQLLQKVQELGTQFSFRELLDKLTETSAPNEKIQKFLEANINGQGSIRDWITARMTNQLAHVMGQPTDTDAQKVKKIREEEKLRPQVPLKPGEIDPFRR